MKASVDAYANVKSVQEAIDVLLVSQYLDTLAAVGTDELILNGTPAGSLAL